MMTLSLAVRNLLRNRRRSVATLLAVAIGSAAILIFGGYATNISLNMLTHYVRNGGHLQVQHRDFLDFGSGNPAAYGISDYGRIVSAIKDDPVLKRMITVVTPMLQFGGIAGNYDEGVSRTVIGTGLKASDVNAMRAWNEYAVREVAPHFVLEGAAPDAALVGVGVARVLLLCDALKIANCAAPQGRSQPKAGAALPTDIAELASFDSAGPTPKLATGTAKLELLASNSRGAPNVAALTVVSAERQGFKELDEVVVITQLEQAQKLVYGKSAPRATALLVQLTHTSQMNDAAVRLKEIVTNAAPDKLLSVHTFEALNPFYVQSQQLFDTIFGFIFVLIGGIVLFTVGNTMNAAVVERTVEVGTLRAVGLRQSGIHRLFLTEGLVVGCVGAVVGVAAALVFAFAFNSLHLTWVPPGASQRVSLSLIVWGQNRMIVGTTITLILIAVGSAWWPAKRAARLKIVDALRHA
jgi:putative ABC transport system permease protein